MTRLIVALGILLSLAGAANALGRLFLAQAPIVCGAMNGQVDLSFCSNAAYVALIF